MQENLYFQNYNYTADIISIILGCIIFIYIRSTYISKQIQTLLLVLGNSSIILAAIVSILVHHLYSVCPDAVLAIYILHHISFILLIMAYTIFARYLVLLTKLKNPEKTIIHYLVVAILWIFIIVESLTYWLHIGFYVEDGNIIQTSFDNDPFKWAYIGMTCICVYLIIRHKKMFVTKVFRCLMSIVVILYVIASVEDYLNSLLFINFTFIIPGITVLFLFHYNAYDIKTGTFDYNAFKGYMDDIRKSDYSLICLELPKLDDTRLEEMSEDFYHFNERFFKKPMTFRVSDKFILVYKPEKRDIILQKKKRILADFEKLYQKYKKDYKMIFLDSKEHFSSGDDCLRFLDDVLNRMAMNTVRQINDSEIERYRNQRNIIEELDDIMQKRDLDDDRVVVYAQPIFDVKTGKYTSAEALMRLVPTGKNMVFPDQFIPLAEVKGCIHFLSEIILNKVCGFIRNMIDEGYEFDRISINFSFIELRDKNFCNDIISIVKRHNIPFDKIAIELTESRNEEDFELVSKIISVLHSKGIKFYLDDFGTGYSNMDRILKLPIDVIKFDRSLTASSGQEENSRMLVGSFSEIFKKTRYQILFEGVEDETDEARCKDMNANYLQGYKYSKPIDINRMRDFFTKMDCSE